MKPWRVWQDWVRVVAGVWLFASPWIYGVVYDSVSSRNAWVFGALMLIVALWNLAAPEAKWLRWVGGLLGLWILLSPILIAAPVSFARNSIVVGVVSVILSMWLVAKSKSGQAKISA